MDDELPQKIINTYGQTLSKREGTVGLESELHFPKDIIRQAIIEELLGSEIDSETRNPLIGVYS